MRVSSGCYNRCQAEHLLYDSRALDRRRDQLFVWSLARPYVAFGISLIDCG